MPGVPDVYQGTEWLGGFPGRPRQPASGRLRGASPAARVVLDARARSSTRRGAAKLWLVRQALRARAEHPELFATYEPLPADGQAPDHLVGFDRGGAITLATRLPATLAPPVAGAARPSRCPTAWWTC